MAFTVVVPPGTVDLGTVDPGSGSDPGAWYFYEGNQVITGGTDLSARAAQTSVYIGKEAQIRFGAVLKLGITSQFRTDALSGYLSIEANDSGTNTIAKFLLLGGMKVVDNGGGTWSDVQVTGGELTISESTIVGAWDQGGGSHTIGFNSDKLSGLNVRGGTLLCRRGLDSTVMGYIGGTADVTFRRAQQIASSAITASGSGGGLTIDGKAKVKWCGEAIQSVYLKSDDCLFDWFDMPTAATIALVEGSAKAIARSGLRQGPVNTLRNGQTLTVTAVTPKGGTLEDAGYGGGGTLGPIGGR